MSLPPTDLRTRMEGNILKIFDPIRQKFVALTPEEYVRQHFTAWLTGDLGYPKSLMNNEVSITLNNMHRRCDTVVFRSDGSPLMIVEYKAPHIKITQKVFDQIARYNMTLQSRYLCVSNGMQHYCCEMDYVNDTYRFLAEVPTWSADL